MQSYMNLILNESDISGLVNNSDLDKRLAAKAELKAEQNKTVKLKTYDSSLFIGQSYFLNDGSQNLLMSQPVFHTFTMPAGLTQAILA